MKVYLLERIHDPRTDSIELDGTRWTLISRDINISGADETEFICISYTWGPSKVANLFDTDVRIASHTVPALTTVARQRPSCNLFWVDAFCVPQESPEREQTLESMGFIYSAASEVITVLSPETKDAVKAMETRDHICFQHLPALESDAWVSRAWTYQEAANSKILSFTYEGAKEDSPVDAMKALNCIGYTLALLADHENYIDMIQPYPHLNLLQNLLGDYCIGMYQATSALAVMSNMEQREQERPDDHYYAMIGVLSHQVSSSQTHGRPYELFMTICEDKGDYSFIYSMATRDTRIERTWRPSGDMHALLVTHSWGAKQTGHIAGNGRLVLDHVMVLDLTDRISEDVEFLRRPRSVIHKKATTEEGVALAQQIFNGLHALGFSGEGACLYATKGLFFPIQTMERHQVMSVLVSAEIRWSFGSPGLVRYRCDDGEAYSAGVYVGDIDERNLESVELH